MPSRTPSRAHGTAAGADIAALNFRWAFAFAETLADAGVRDAVLAPGSRSAPLALALDRAGLRVHVAIDERAGAYFALGLAKASRRPAAVLTTSGTAAANLHPATLEALHARVPLILLTADRPPELRDTGAPQTADQLKLFGASVLWFAEVGAPAPGEEGVRYAASLGTRAARAAQGPPSGPVHLNFAFREPLVPDPDALDAIAPRRAAREDAPAAGPDRPLASHAAIRRVAGLLRARRRGVIACGPDDHDSDLAEPVARLAAVTGYPILADPLSGVRFGPHDRSRVLGAYDLFLRSAAFAEREEPETILHFGAPLTSKAFHRYSERHPRALRIAVDPAGGWRDPSRRLLEVLRGDPAATASSLADALERGAEPLPDWWETYARAERSARRALERHVGASASLGEEGVFPAILEGIPDGGTLYAGNSMIVRDLDATAPSSAKRIRVLANRGVNGIDGVVSSALGASAATNAPLLVVVGDLSFHHDLNALSMLREGRARAAIVVVNNDGGGIFSFLPVAEHGTAFERLFGTPHGLDFARVAALYGVPHASVTTAEALRERAASTLESRATALIEVRTDRAANRAAHQTLWGAAIRSVEEAS